MTDINNIKRELEALTAKVAAYEAEKATKRNWPERIEAGMVFRQENGSRYLVCGSKFVNLDTGALWLLGGGPSGDDKTDLIFLGKLDLTIRTDAHEPTGAELVGRVCEFSDDGENWTDGARPREQGDPRICIGYDGKSDRPYSNRWAEWKLARLAK